jgi:hypothetical protein
VVRSGQGGWVLGWGWGLLLGLLGVAIVVVMITAIASGG